MARPLGLLIASIFFSAVSVPVAADEPAARSFESRGDCVESALGVPVDAAKAQALLPEGFVVREVGGRALVAAFAEDCIVSIDGSKEFAVTASGTLLFLSSPAGVYDLTWNGDEPAYFNAYHRLGIGSLIPGSTYEAAATAPGVIHSEALIPGDFSFSFDATDAATPDDIEDALISVHWGYGRFGAVKGTYPHDIRTVLGGTGVLHADPGSPLQQLIGSHPVRAPGLFFRFHFSGTVEIVDF